MKRKRDLVAAAAGSLFCSHGFRIQQHSKGRGRNLGVLHLVEGWGKHDDSQAHTRRAHGQRVPGCPCGRGGQRVPFFLALSVLVYTVHAPDLGSISCLIPDRSGRWFWTGAFLGFRGDGGWTYTALWTLCLAVVVDRRVGNIACEYTKYSEGTLVVIISVARGFSPCFNYLVSLGLWWRW